ncbi:hypothetical protein CJF30_00005284 [Rutstroemia sp. NJR-2017a BBW]|nr:hypothetical protein CJF30_00005284 [Rutstroemia sp. NJR-2017a BBW]
MMEIEQELREVLSKDAVIVTPKDHNYKQAIKRWSVTAEKEAPLVVFPACTSDISHTVRLTTEYDLDLAVTGGSHSTSGQSSTSTGVSLNLSLMKEVLIDTGTKTITAQGGATWADVDAAAAKHGLVTVGGTVNRTGIGGLTLGGGYGYLSGKYGLAVDNLVAAEVVLADGKVAWASKKENPGLFWAVRGAGAGFGVVSEFVFRGYEHRGEVWGGMMAFERSEIEGVVGFANKLMKREDLKGVVTMMVGFTTPPPIGRSCVVAVLFYDGEEEKAREFFGPLKELGPLMDRTGMMPYPQMNALHNPTTPDGDRRTMKGATFTYPLDWKFVDGMYAEYVRHTEEIPDANKTLVLFEFIHNGKIMEVPLNAMAFANRGEWGNVVIVSGWTESKWDERCRAWTREMARRVEMEAGGEKKGDGVGVYVNYDGEFALTVRCSEFRLREACERMLDC